MTTSEYSCKSCKKLFTARTADRARGWALYCSKSCKAIKQEARTGQYRESLNERMNDEALYTVQSGWDEHKDFI